MTELPYLGWKNKETYLAHLKLLSDAHLYRYLKEAVLNYRSNDEYDEVLHALECIAKNELDVDRIDIDELCEHLARS